MPILDLHAATGLVGDGEHDGHDGKAKPAQNRLAGWLLGLFVVVWVGRRWLLGIRFREREENGILHHRRELSLHRTITSPTAVHPRQSGRYAGTIVVVRQTSFPAWGNAHPTRGVIRRNSDIPKRFEYGPAGQIHPFHVEGDFESKGVRESGLVELSQEADTDPTSEDAAVGRSVTVWLVSAATRRHGFPQGGQSFDFTTAHKRFNCDPAWDRHP